MIELFHFEAENHYNNTTSGLITHPTGNAYHTMKKTLDTTQVISDKFHARATGCLFLLDSDQQLMQIYFVNGEMTFIKARNKTGKKALDVLAAMQPIKFQFHEDIETHNASNLPSTTEIIDILKRTKPEETATTFLSPELEEKAKDLFLEYVGPIATIIFEEQIEKSSSVNQLIQILSTYIDDDKDKQAFIESAKTIA